MCGIAGFLGGGAGRDLGRVARAMADANAKRKLARVLPSDRAIERWIDQAKRLQLKITY